MNNVLLMGSESYMMKGDEVEIEVNVEASSMKRDYSCVSDIVISHYRNLRSKQTHSHVQSMHDKFKHRERRPLKIWKALEIM